MNLNQVTVSVGNIKISIDFYQKLGLTLIVQADHYARFECPKGEATFSIHLSDQETGNCQTSVYFEIEDLDAYVDKLVESGFIFTELPNDKPWLWREARLKDPDNNTLILYKAGINRKYPPWRII